ncbi:YbaY family lipoprotein [Vibrio sp. SS-MA-C1-2]|uniref:YbaY family lipoprotein n=1 Tax=Vibrio sp. SS-MA-C1-2 TaxID=2908646 RepID=UPI001F30BBD4|nr:YbaY family lipoprotein [Vibrio sp. SS-MA-C1-2]UJF19873.1 YbaY family lipoprotein [Vibrio sp. SS-MA-C1-2]
MKGFRYLFLAFIALFVTACGSEDKVEMSTVSGEVSYLSKIAIPAEAVVTVTLSDVSRVDAPAEELTALVFNSDGKQSPFPFELQYDKSQIKENNRYVVRATITMNDKLMFTTDKAYPVINDPSNTDKVELVLVRAPRG